MISVMFILLWLLNLIAFIAHIGLEARVTALEKEAKPDGR